MNTYCILTMEESFSRFDNLFDLAIELREKAPQVDWMVGEEKILNYDDQYQNRLCIKVPKMQYEAAKYLYHLVNSSEQDKLQSDPNLKKLEDLFAYLSHFCSFSVDEEDIENQLLKLGALLAEIYSIGAQLSKGVNLHLIPENDELIDLFHRDWIVSEDPIQEEIYLIQDNINFINGEAFKYYPFEEVGNSPLTAGIVYELYQSFHSLKGWGMKVLETINLIHQLVNRLQNYQSNNKEIVYNSSSLKGVAKMWLKEQMSKEKILQSYESNVIEHLLWDIPHTLPSVYSFPLKGFADEPEGFADEPEGFADEPEVFVQPTEEGLNFGYHSFYWDGHILVPRLAIKHTLPWDMLELLTETEKEALAFDKLLKTISSRKRQYKTCQFCGEKNPPEHLFNARTCYGCAEVHFHVIF